MYDYFLFLKNGKDSMKIKNDKDNPVIVFDSEEEFSDFSRLYIFGKKMYDDFIGNSKF